MKIFFSSILIGSLFFCSVAWAKVDVVTTTTTLKSLAQYIGGDRVNVISITKGSQDPHYIEAKPSYMVKLRGAELLMVVGLDLEVGWIDNIARGSRNPKVLPGNLGYFNAGLMIHPIEVPEGRIDRSLGDIHPGGNPHFYLDPKRMKKIAKMLSLRLSALDPEGKKDYENNLKVFETQVNKKLLSWKDRVKGASVKKVITYHRTINYFLNRFGVKFAAAIESKPGVPPTAKQILSLIKLIKAQKIKCILVESFFELKAAQRIQKDTNVKVIRVPVEVDALPNTSSYFDLIENLVQAIETCGEVK